jgi:hypothetical protein
MCTRTWLTWLAVACVTHCNVNKETNIKIYVLYICVCVCVYLYAPWCRVLLEKLTGLQLVKKFPAFYGTRRFITALTSHVSIYAYIILKPVKPVTCVFLHRHVVVLNSCIHLGDHCTVDVTQNMSLAYTWDNIIRGRTYHCHNVLRIISYEIQ